MPSTLAALITSAATTVMGGVGALTQPWAAVSGTHLALLGGAAVLLCVGYVFSTMTMRVGVEGRRRDHNYRRAGNQ